MCVVFFCVCGSCVIECAMVYGVLLLTVCAHVDLKQTSVSVRFVWDLMCDVVRVFVVCLRCFVFVRAWCLMFVRCL